MSHVDIFTYRPRRTVYNGVANGGYTQPDGFLVKAYDKRRAGLNVLSSNNDPADPPAYGAAMCWDNSFNVGSGEMTASEFNIGAMITKLDSGGLVPAALDTGPVSIRGYSAWCQFVGDYPNPSYPLNTDGKDADQWWGNVFNTDTATNPPPLAHHAWGGRDYVMSGQQQPNFWNQLAGGSFGGGQIPFAKQAPSLDVNPLAQHPRYREEHSSVLLPYFRIRKRRVTIRPGQRVKVVLQGKPFVLNGLRDRMASEPTFCQDPDPAGVMDRFPHYVQAGADEKADPAVAAGISHNYMTFQKLINTVSWANQNPIVLYGPGEKTRTVWCAFRISGQYGFNDNDSSVGTMPPHMHCMSKYSATWRSWYKRVRFPKPVDYDFLSSDQTPANWEWFVPQYTQPIGINPANA